MNKLARAVTKWTKACDKRLARLISYNHHTCDYKQYCHVGNIVNQCTLGLFQDSDFAGDLEDSKSTSGSSQHGWEKVPNWECLFVHREKGLFLSVYVDDMKLAGKKQNLDPMWKLLNKEVDLEEPTSFVDHVLGLHSKTM